MRVHLHRLWLCSEWQMPWLWEGIGLPLMWDHSSCVFIISSHMWFDDVIYVVHSSSEPGWCFTAIWTKTILSGLKMVSNCVYKIMGFHTVQCMRGFALRFTHPLKTKQFRKLAANRSTATQSHRKCLDSWRTIVVELGGVCFKGRGGPQCLYSSSCLY